MSHLPPVQSVITLNLLSVYLNLFVMFLSVKCEVSLHRKSGPFYALFTLQASLFNQAMKSIKLILLHYLLFSIIFNILISFPAWGQSIIYLEQLLHPYGGCSLLPIRLLYCLQSEDSHELQWTTTTWCESIFVARKNFHNASSNKVLLLQLPELGYH